MENNAVGEPNVFGSIALEAAYNYGEEWLSQLLIYLEDNLNYLTDYISNKIPKLKVVRPEGTYLVWIDCSMLNMTYIELRNLFVKNAKLGFDDGVMFGEEGQQFQRINIACPRPILTEALNRMEKAINS